MSAPPSYDESIPVLTEVVLEAAPVPPPPAADPVEAPAGPVHLEPVAQDAAQDADVAPAAPQVTSSPAGTLDDDAWRALEERLVARVLDRLQDRVELVLEDQVRTSMAPVLDHLVTRLAADLHDGLQHTVEQVVARAVAQELAHLKSRSS